MAATFERQARSAGVRDARVLAAMAAVPREAFVPPEWGSGADVDAPIPLPLGQTTSQPSLIGLMVEALDLTGTERVLEVGTGYGYQAAVLSLLAREVWTLEWFAPLARAARGALHAFGADNVHVVVGDGRSGLAERAPFDAVVVAAQTDEVPAPLVRQLVEGGRLVLPLGGSGHQEAVVLRCRGGRVEQVGSLGGVRFVPLLQATTGPATGRRFRPPGDSP